MKNGNPRILVFDRIRDGFEAEGPVGHMRCLCLCVIRLICHFVDNVVVVGVVY